MLPRFVIGVVVAGVTLTGVATAGGAGDASVAALQVALRQRGIYAGPVDGVIGAATVTAVRVLQSRRGLAADGVAGPRTRRLLGPFARHQLGSRTLAVGQSGWDVAELQFALAWRGFPSGAFDGSFGAHLEGAVRRFQRWARLPSDGIAGPVTIAALKLPLPQSQLTLAWPLSGPLDSGFGPRGDRFHAGIDLAAAEGTPVRAAAPGSVVWVGPRAGWGLLVTVAHADGVRTLYAHLSKADVRLGERVNTETVIGQVGATGDATGPHLHLEVRVNGPAIDPVTALAPLGS